LRSGFVAGDPNLMRRLKMLRNYAGASPPPPILAASAALWRDEAHVEANRALYRRKFDVADQIMSGRLGYYRPDGAFYLWLDVGDGEEACKALWGEAGVRVIPGTYLAREIGGVNPGKPYIRVALVQEPDVIADALHRIVETLT
jgi:aspartate/methionine/tyrosine aminotransferase